MNIDRSAPPYTTGLPSAEEILLHIPRGGLWHCRLTDEKGRSCAGVVHLYVNEMGRTKMRRPAWWPHWMPGDTRLTPSMIRVRPCAEDLTPLPSVGGEPAYEEGLPSRALIIAHMQPVVRATHSGPREVSYGLWHCQVVWSQDGAVAAAGIIGMRARPSSRVKIDQAKWWNDIRAGRSGFFPKGDGTRSDEHQLFLRTRPCDADLSPVPWPRAVTMTDG